MAKKLSKRIDRILSISFAVAMVFGLLTLYYGEPVQHSNAVAVKGKGISAIQPDLQSGLLSLNLKEKSTFVHGITDGKYNLTFITTTLYSPNANTTGYVFTDLLNGNVIGALIERLQVSDKGTYITLVPIYSRVLNNTINYMIPQQHSKKTTVNAPIYNDNSVATPDLQIFPAGTYSQGMYGWAYSWNNYNTQGLELWTAFITSSGTAVATGIAAAVATGVATALAAVLIPFIIAASAGIALVNWMGGYHGVFVAESTSWFSAFAGYPPYGVIWLGANPVPGGY